jgi:septal ring factor EnvC (AmiA/AmiB activator)
MSDDLVKRLRNSKGWPTLGNAAADRIEELEAENKLLNEQMAAIEEHGTESLNALPDCLMRLAPALVEVDELKAKLENLIAGAETVLEEWDRGDEAAFREAIEEMRADVAAAKGEK